MLEKKQRFEWGTIEWLFLPNNTSNDNMHIGISTIWPHTIQTKHTHYGDEQLMYIISGYGEQRIGDELTKIEPGRIFHISSGSIHETKNHSDEPIIKLLISIPVSLSAYTGAIVDSKQRNNKQERKYTKVTLLSIIEQLYDRLISPLKMPVAFYDSEHNLLQRNKEYPDYCKGKCHVERDINNCPLYAYKDNLAPPYYADATAYICSHGIALYNLAIMYKGNLIGFIKAGHVRVSVGNDEIEKMPYEVPQSTVSGIVQTMHRLASDICELYQLEDMQMELIRQEGDITKQHLQKTTLQESLKTTQAEMFNIQVEQHFLFNTLSTIASMAIREKAINTYKAVNDLAQLFRYTSRVTKLFVELHEELEYLENYTNLQKLRYEDRLKVTYIISPSLLSEMVPFNFIQPVVENCFKHAFKHSTVKIMRLTIQVKKNNTNLVITVQDNGSGIDKKAIQIINNRIKSVDNSGGTAMVVRKLSSLYGNNYNFQIEQRKKGVVVSITIPLSSKGR
ncbi:MAG: histidine kinase [Lachnospiraceae bacterium]